MARSSGVGEPHACTIESCCIEMAASEPGPSSLALAWDTARVQGGFSDDSSESLAPNALYPRELENLHRVRVLRTVKEGDAAQVCPYDLPVL